MKTSLFFIGSLLIVASVTQAQPLSPGQIFAKTIAAYQSAATYQDTGEVRDTIEDTDPGFLEPTTFIIVKAFQTAYVRKTGQFRFRYRDIKPKAQPVQFIAWSDGKQYRKWWAISPKVRRTATLADAIDGAGGISGQSSSRIPSLLLPTINPPFWALTDLKRTVVLPPMVMAGKTCYHVQGALDLVNQMGVTARSAKPLKGPTPTHPAVDVWIDATTFLLIRIALTYTERTKTYTYVQTYYPLLNQPVKPETLAFNYTDFQ